MLIVKDIFTFTYFIKDVKYRRNLHDHFFFWSKRNLHNLNPQEHFFFLAKTKTLNKT